MVQGCLLGRETFPPGSCPCCGKDAEQGRPVPGLYHEWLAEDEATRMRPLSKWGTPEFPESMRLADRPPPAMREVAETDQTAHDATTAPQRIKTTVKFARQVMGDYDWAERNRLLSRAKERQKTRNRAPRVPRRHPPGTVPRKNENNI